MSTSKPEALLLLSPKQVRDLSKTEHVALLDATWFFPNSTRSAKNEFLDKRLPSAQFLDLDEVASPHEFGIKHMMPEPHVFAEACGKFGVKNSTYVVIYDTHGVLSSPRALFMFRAFGHKKSSILDGGLPRWVDEGLPVETLAPLEPSPTSYSQPELDQHMIRNFEQMVSNSLFDTAKYSAAEIVLDSRPKEKFTGTTPESRPDIPSGHIPNSFSLPFDAFLQKHASKAGNFEYTTLLPQERLAPALEASVGRDQAQSIIDGKRSVAATCNSGMTAAVLWLGLKLLGSKDVGLYDEVRHISNVQRGKLTYSTGWATLCDLQVSSPRIEMLHQQSKFK